MFLTAASVTPYLIARRLVAPAAVVDGPFTIVDVTRRNRNFKVVLGNGEGLFLKQPRLIDAQAAATLQCEAACCWLSRHEAAFSALRPLTPDLYWYDLERHVLITALLPGETIQAYVSRTGSCPAALNRALGTRLGTYHRTRLVASTAAETLDMFPRQVPWILCADRRNSHPFKMLSPATSALFDLLDESPETLEALEGLRREWRIETIVHGDVRFENCILTWDGTGEAEVTLVDWEMAIAGDRRWDVAGVLQGYLCAAALLPASVGIAAAGFWTAYTQARGVDEADAHTLLSECAAYAAARLIQTAYEQAQFSADLSPLARHLLIMSGNMLRDPDAAASLLLAHGDDQ